MKILNSKNNFLGLTNEFSGYENSEIVILSFPFYKSGKGKINGPGEILKASRGIIPYDEEQKRELCFEKGICSLAPINFEKSSTNKSLENISKEIKTHISNGKFVVSLGGEQTISAAILNSIKDKYQNLSLLHFSAHSYSDELIIGKKKIQGNPISHISNLGIDVAQVGVRSQSKNENDFRRSNGIKTFYAREIKMGLYGKNWQELISKNIKENVYISFNLHAFDPSLMPAVANAEPGGLFWDETMNLLKIIGMDKNIIGFDVVELLPSKNFISSNYFSAKLIYKILNYAFINQ